MCFCCSLLLYCSAFVYLWFHLFYPHSLISAIESEVVQHHPKTCNMHTHIWIFMYFFPCYCSMSFVRPVYCWKIKHGKERLALNSFSFANCIILNLIFSGSLFLTLELIWTFSKPDKIYMERKHQNDKGRVQKQAGYNKEVQFDVRRCTNPWS